LLIDTVDEDLGVVTLQRLFDGSGRISRTCHQQINHLCRHLSHILKEVA
jgi:hypothetical protein